MRALIKSTRRMWTVGVQVADDITLASGNKSSEKAVNILADLKTFTEANWPVTLVDIDGTSWSVNIISQSYDEQITADESPRGNERVVMLTMVEMKTS